MKRDWDVIREVLIEVEGLKRQELPGFFYSTDPNGDPKGAAKADQALILYRAGFLNGTLTEYFSDPSTFHAPVLTWSGYDLLETMRSKPIWDRIKTTAQEKGLELTFDAVKVLGKQALDWIVT